VITLFSTSDVDPRDRFDYWHSVACKSVIDHDSVPDCRQSFEAELKAAMLADIGLLQAENSPISVTVTTAQAAQARSDELFVCRPLRGTMAVEQESRQLVLDSGDITLIDPRFAHEMRFGSSPSLLMLKLPRRLVEERLGSLHGMSARAIRPSNGDSRFVSEFLATLPAYAGRLGKPAEQLVMDQTVELIALAFAETAERGPRLSSARAVVMMRVRAAIDARLPDPRLDSKAVAAAAGVSLRHANAVLAQRGTSIRRLIQVRRLARCRTALEDPMQAHRSISEIAYGWGFSDMTHFGRRFREAYGLAPSEYRRLARPDPR
jgi:AraC family transcriptional regulator, positive regulator of tynA and feaB